MKIIDVLAYFGTFVFALTGAFKARSFKMDIFGGLVLAFVTAYGGGTLRDLLIGRVPVNWINDNVALSLVLGATVLTFLVKEGVNNFQKTIFITDALGLGFFTVVGIEVTFQKQINESYALVMGITTATFGGMIADILTNNVPSLLKKGELYATACAVGGFAYLLLRSMKVEYTTGLILCILITAAIRIYSVRKNIKLPGI